MLILSSKSDNLYFFFFLLAATLTNFVSLKLLDLKSQYFDKEACEVFGWNTSLLLADLICCIGQDFVSSSFRDLNNLNSLNAP